MSIADLKLPPYPLAEVLILKKKRVADAEEEVNRKRKALETEKEKLKAAEEARDKVKNHHDEKLRQLRQEYDEGTTSVRIDRCKLYLKVVKEKLQIEEKKVKQQQAQVEIAEKNLILAQEELKKKRKEQDKIEEHQKYWKKETIQELLLDETRQEDELGSLMFLSRFIQEKNNKERMKE